MGEEVIRGGREIGSEMEQGRGGSRRMTENGEEREGG